MREEAKPDRLQRILKVAFVVVAVAMVTYQLVYTQYILQEGTGHRVTHLSFAFVVVFLSMLAQSKRRWVFKWILLLASLAVALYLMVSLDDILRYRSAMPLLWDQIIGFTGIVITIVASYLVFGRTLPILAILFLAYLFLGRYLPFPFTVAPVSLSRGLVWLSTPGIEDGLYGSVIAISANYLFLFVIFGAFLQGFGGLRFIRGIGEWLGAKLRSGPAATAVIGSSLVGTVTGSTMANVTITGSFTIPMMKQVGYRPEEAGAIEAAASNGGQIMPPVMGAAAFVMSGYTGIPYATIAVAAVGPALLYYLCVFLYVELTARKINIQAVKVAVSGKQLLLDAPVFIVPLAILVALLARGFSLPYVAFWSIMSIIVIGLLGSIRKEARISFRELRDVITSGAVQASQIAIICALIGLIVTSILVSGLGVMLPILIQDISGGRLIIALLIAAVASIILGMGVPTVAAYLLVAVGLSPALAKMGVPLLNAHMYPFILATFSHLTPPVALGVLVAAKIAGSDYWKTGWEAIKAVSVLFLLPFLVIYTPIIMFRPEGDPILSTVQVLSLLLIVLTLEIAATSYCFTLLRGNERLIFFLAGLLFVAFAFLENYFYFIGAVALLALGLVWQLIRRKEIRAAPAPEP